MQTFYVSYGIWNFVMIMLIFGLGIVFIVQNRNDNRKMILLFAVLTSVWAVIDLVVAIITPHLPDPPADFRLASFTMFALVGIFACTDWLMLILATISKNEETRLATKTPSDV